MKKPKHVIALTALAALTLTGCTKDLVADKTGNVVTVTIDDKIDKISADFLFNDYLKTPEGIRAYYDAVYQVVVRELFEKELPVKRNEFYDKAELRVIDVKDEAKENAKGGKSYDEELKALLKTYHVETLEELKHSFAYEYMKDEVKKQFFDGGDAAWIKDAWDELVVGNAAEDYDGYLKSKLPYHVRHILVKVSADHGNFTSASISKNDALRLGTTIKALANRKSYETFGKLAVLYSEDEGSKEDYGDLGIMSTATGFVNEFKLGIYTYDALFNQTFSVADKEKLHIPADAAQYFKDTIGLGEIPYGAALKLLDNQERELNNNGKVVNDGKTSLFPRNVLFNKYFNKHQISVITPNDVEVSDEVGVENPAYANLAGFEAVAELGGKKVLVDENKNVILAVRAGASGSYEGIHFIVVERSALMEKSADGTTLQQYYTIFTPNDDKYPINEVDGSLRDTFVNFINYTDNNSYKARADKVKTEIQNFDSNINDRIFTKMLEKLNVKFSNKEAESALYEYLDNQKMLAEQKDEKDLEKLWDDWVKYIKQQEVNRTIRLVPEQYINVFINGRDFGDGKGVVYDYDYNKRGNY